MPKHHLTKAIDGGMKAVSKKIAKSRSRTGREATTLFAVSKIAERLSIAEASFAADWFSKLAEVVDTDEVNHALLGTTARLGQQHLLSALEALRPS